MLVLGIESSCDECSFALVKDGREIISHVVATQIDFHKPYDGVVPEIASRKHIEMITPVFRQCLAIAADRGVGIGDIDGIGVATHPGLSGSLVVGLNYAKALSLSLGVPYTGVNHILAHLYAPQLAEEIPYPYLGLLVSGGHTMITRVNSYDDIEVMGASIDDACGEAFDKVAKHYGLGYPGGKVIDELARTGDPKAYRFPFSNLYKGGHDYDVSYSGLKNAAINQLDKFWDGKSDQSLENICASFERVAIDSLIKKLEKAAADSGITTIVAGGGVAANTYLRSALGSHPEYRVHFPPMELCTDNGAMIAGIAYHYLEDRRFSPLDLGVSARVKGFRRI
jgi:N6-L-threonylcarbamoyladenine synthase